MTSSAANWWVLSRMDRSGSAPALMSSGWLVDVLIWPRSGPLSERTGLACLNASAASAQ